MPYTYRHTDDAGQTTTVAFDHLQPDDQRDGDILTRRAVFDGDGRQQRNQLGSRQQDHVRVSVRFTRQTVVADPTRGDGHDQDGIPGDCLRAAVASLLDLPLHEVPHFALYRSWWDTMRRWVRDTYGLDFACLAPVNGTVRPYLLGGDDPEWSGLLIGNGPSPRGPFWHVSIVDADLELVHDPHPSDMGLREVVEVFALTQPYWPPPAQLALTAT